MERKKITFDSFIRGVILGVIIIGILMLFKRLSGVLLPFFIAWLIAYLIYPLVTFFQYRLRLKNRVISIFCALFSILIVGGTAFYLLVPPMMDEFVRVKDLVIDYFSNGTHDGNVPKTLSEFLRENIDTQFVTQLFKEENMLNAIKETVPRLWSLLSESVNLLFSFFTFFLILLYIVFILLDYESISEGWTHLVPQKYRPFVINVMNDVKDGMNRYFRGQAFVALCVGILFSIGFLIIDFPLAIGLGLFIGALNLVPYLQIIGFIHHRAGHTESSGYGRKLLDYHCIGPCGIHHSTSHSRRIHRTACHGEDYGPESCHHLTVFIDLGVIDGDAGYDYSTSAYHPYALLLSTFHHKQRKNSQV